MRRLGSEKDLEAKRKRSSTIMSIIILAILIFSTAGYAIIMSTNSSTQNVPAKSGTAVLAGNRWVIEVDGRQFSFTNSPDSVANISVPIPQSILNFQGQPVYIVSDNQAITSEIALVLGAYTNVQRACYGLCEEDLPEKDCTEKLIVWKDGSENKIYSEQNCIFIEGDLSTVDAFLYKILNVRTQ